MSRSPKSNKLLIRSGLYRLANLVTFHPMVHQITCRQILFGLILVDKVWQWPWKLDQGHQNLISFLSCPNVISTQIWLKSASWFMWYWAHKHLLAQIWKFKSCNDLENRSRSQKPNQLFSMSQCYIHANLVEICQPVHEIWCTQALFGLNLAV